MTNGNLPLNTLAPLPGFLPYEARYNFRPVTTANHSNLFLSSAIVDAVNMAQDFEAAMHQPLTYAESYREGEVQDWRITEHARGGPLAAAKFNGQYTSNHGLALAVDYRNGIGNGPGSTTYGWMAAHAGSYGFVRDVASEYWHWHHPSVTSVTKPRLAVASTDAITLETLIKKAAKDMVIYIQVNADSKDPRYGKLPKGRNFIIDPVGRTITSIANIEAVTAKAAGFVIVGVSGDNVWQLANNGLKRKGW